MIRSPWATKDLILGVIAVLLSHPAVGVVAFILGLALLILQGWGRGEPAGNKREEPFTKLQGS